MEQIYSLIAAVRREYVPDPRLAVFEVDAVREEDTITFYGAISERTALDALRRGIATLDLDIGIRDEVVGLPVDDPAHTPHAVVRSATAPMLARPLISDSQVSQLVLGSRVLVLREHGRWLQCKSVDGYVGWMHRGYLQRMSEAGLRTWESGVPAPLHHSLGGNVVAPNGDVIAPIPWGARFGLAGDHAHLPDGTVGQFSGEAVALAELPRRFPKNGQSVVETAIRWLGSPYLWGGITPAGVDCSGLVQAVLRAHGVEMPRDSDQQALVGTEVDFRATSLQPGDLLFFAERGDRVSHVAISMGGSKLVHSALGKGGVGCNDFAGGSGFESELRTLLRSARRVIVPQEPVE